VHPVAELLVKLAASAVLALAVGLLDGPLFAVQIPWWVCAAIGMVLVFGGVLIITHADDL
jgi:membrane protein YdbS with pleckstrin-like domain